MGRAPTSGLWFWTRVQQEAEDRTETLEVKVRTLEVKVGKYMDTSLIRADLQPHFIRLLIKGKLLQLELGVEVRCGQYHACTLPSPSVPTGMGAAH
jgi:hypothetical protein